MKKYIVIIILIFSYLTIIAQSERDTTILKFRERVKNPYKGSLSLNVDFGSSLVIPLDDFFQDQKISTEGFSFSVASGVIGMPVKGLFNIGFSDFTWGRKGEVKQSIIYKGYDAIETNELLTRNVFSQIGIRLKPDWLTLFQPYADAYIGFNHLISKETKEIKYTAMIRHSFIEEEKEKNISNRIYSDWSLAYGSSLGIRIRWFNPILQVNIKVSYQGGTTANYHVLKEDPPTTSNIVEKFELNQSKTNMLIFSFGASIGL